MSPKGREDALPGRDQQTAGTQFRKSVLRQLIQELASTNLATCENPSKR